MSLTTSLTGMNSSLQWLNRISNNLANENTAGYAAREGSFADTYTEQTGLNQGVQTQSGRLTPPGWYGGTGVLAVADDSNFSQMPLEMTGNPLDFALQGNAFFLVRGANGQQELTLKGSFQWSQHTDGQWYLSTDQGEPVLDTKGQPIVTKNGQPAKFDVSAEGDISINGVTTGQKIAIVNVAAPSAMLDPAGNTNFALKPGAQLNILNQNTGASSASIVQGALDMSNVDMTKEMTDMIQAQRLFDLNAEALQASNRMLQDANNIRK